MTDLTNKTVEELHAQCCDDAGSNKYLDELVRRAKANDQLRKAAEDYRDASSNLHQSEHINQDDGVWFLDTQEALDEALNTDSIQVPKVIPSNYFHTSIYLSIIIALILLNIVTAIVLPNI